MLAYPLVYLAAYLIPDGEAMVPMQLSDTESLLNPNLVLDEERGYATVRPEAVREVFYADCSEEDVTLASSSLRPEAVAPLLTPLHITEKGFASVRRVYIETLNDRAVTLALQRKIQAALTCQEVFTLETCHSPFFSAPEKLVDLLALL